MMEENNEKCLVSEAMDKCKCKWCEMSRRFRDLCIAQQIKVEEMKIYHSALKEAGVIPK